MKRILLGVMLTLLLSTNAMASIYTFTATSINSYFSSFTIDFDSDDTIFTLDEVDDFSGLQIGARFFDELIMLRPLKTAEFELAGGQTWGFIATAGNNKVNVSSNAWTFSLSGGPATPIPGAVWLLGTGLLGLAGLRRSKRA